MVCPFLLRVVEHHDGLFGGGGVDICLKNGVRADRFVLVGGGVREIEYGHGALLCDLFFGIHKGSQQGAYNVVRLLGVRVRSGRRS